MTITLAEVGALLMGLAALVTAIITVIQRASDAKATKKRLDSESVTADSHAADSYASAAEKVAKQNLELQHRLDTLECRMDELLKAQKIKDETIRVLQDDVKKKTLRIVELEETVQRLQSEVDELRGK